MDNINIKKSLLGYVNENYTIIEVLNDYVIAENVNAPCEYVTWLVDSFPATYGGYIHDFYYGHYFRLYSDALQDLYERAAKNVSEV